MLILLMINNSISTKSVWGACVDCLAGSLVLVALFNGNDLNVGHGVGLVSPELREVGLDVFLRGRDVLVTEEHPDSLEVGAACAVQLAGSGLAEIVGAAAASAPGHESRYALSHGVVVERPSRLVAAEHHVVELSVLAEAKLIHPLTARSLQPYLSLGVRFLWL